MKDVSKTEGKILLRGKGG